MSAPDPLASEPAPASLGELVRCLWRVRLALLAWALGGLALAALYSALARPSFRAQATILIQQQGTSGLLGDLAMLASLASTPATASELSVLASRTLAEQVVDDGSDAEGRWNPLDEKSAGLATLVEDDDLRPLALLSRQLFGEPRPELPLVLPPQGLLARATPEQPDAPLALRLEFLGATRVRIARAGLLQTLHLAARDVEEHDFAPREAFVYQGLRLELEPWGEFEGKSFALEALPRHEAIDRLQERLSVRETALNSGVIEVALEDSDPRRAARTVNALCSRYLESLAQRGQKRASKTVEYVQGLLDEEFQRFKKAEDEIMRLQQANPELIAPEGAATTLIEQMSQIEVERVQLELSQRAFGEIVSALEAGDRRALAQIDSTLNVGVLVDPVTTGLLSELARLDAEAGALGTDLLEGHPLLTHNDAATKALLARTKEQLDSRMAGLRARSAELERVEGELRTRMAGMPEGLRGLAETRIELGIHSELVPYLIKSLQGAEITRSSAETLAELVDPATAPDELDAPDFVRLAALGLLAGLGLGIVLAFVREPARGRIHTGPELAAALGTEGVTNLARLGTRELVFQKARASPAAQTLRALRGALRFDADGTARRAIGVTTLGGEREGVALAAELALAFESEGRRTLLVEATFADPEHGPELGPVLGREAAPGLAQHLENGEPWPEHVHVPKSGPPLLQAGRPHVSAGDLLARANAERFLAEACAQYDVVVLALPESASLLAAPGFVRALDVLCLVHRARSLPRAEVRSAAVALRAAGARALAGVLVEKRA